MPRVAISYVVHAHTNEEALRMAMEARSEGKKSVILTDEEGERMIREDSNGQDLIKWANENNVKFVPSI